jgi:hypothetical protein
MSIFFKGLWHQTNTHLKPMQHVPAAYVAFLTLSFMKIGPFAPINPRSGQTVTPRSRINSPI